MIYDATLHTLSVDVVFSNLSAPTIASHIHCCTATADTGAAGVATTTPTFLGFPTGVTAGTYTKLLDLTLNSSWNPAFITANGGTTTDAEAELAAGLAAGEAYLNIHTTAFPGGEISGFLAPVSVPEPGMAWLSAPVLAAMAMRVKRKRAATGAYTF